jgi:hypothetical protein
MAAVASLGIAIVLSQQLGAGGKGEQSLIITTIAMMMLAANLLAGAALVYLAPRFPLLRLLLPSAVWSLLTGLAAWVFLQLVPLVPAVWAADVALLTALCALAGIFSNFLIGRERVPAANLTSLLQPLLVLAWLGITWALKAELSIRDYVHGLYLAYGISALSGIIFLKKEWRKPVECADITYRHIIRQMLEYGAMNQMAHIFQLLSLRMGFYFLDHFSGTASLGQYSNAVAIMESVWLLSKSIAVVQYARISNSNDQEYTRRLSLELTRGTLALTALAVLVIALMPSSLWVYVFGAEFGGLQPMMWALAPGTLCYVLVLLLGHHFSGNGQYHFNTRASLAGLPVALAASLTFIPWWGAVGAALASGMSYAVTAAVAFYYFRRGYETSWTLLIPGGRDIRRFLFLLKGNSNPR